MNLTVEEIVKNGEQWNKDWINGIGSKHRLATSWIEDHNKSDVFVETSCEITASMIRWKSGFGDDWISIDSLSFEQVKKISPYFQITIGKNWEHCDHILTVWDTHIIQSYYGFYKIKSLPLTEKYINALDNLYPNNTKLDENYRIISETFFDEYPDYSKIFYWIPPCFAKDNF